MSFNSENYRRVRDAFDTKRKRALDLAAAHTEQLHLKCPEAAEIDRALSRTGLSLFRIACEGGENVSERLQAAEAENLELQAMRAELLKKLGLPADYTEPAYECKLCKDTGVIETRLCDCMRRALVLEGFRTSGLGSLIERQSFENFSLDYYMDNTADYERMRATYGRARDFAENFPNGTGNLLLVGTTGLGKTHLSTAIARRVIERGFDVLYESAPNILSDFEYDRFKSGRNETESLSDKYFDCELLIIDDLGTELVNQFSVSVLYNLLNTRINHRRATVISTNLTAQALREIYDDRITSRLFGEFEPLPFVGKDNRTRF
ncbi:MAG: ATP-binding protein [Clostridia bacterium]|nr:ATP-binding protein [Clostridia bacterium]